MGRESAVYVRRGHLDHLDLVRLDSPYLHGAKDEETFVGKAAGDRDGATAHVGEGLNGSIFANDDCAAIAMAEVDDLDRHALVLERKSEGRDDERSLHAVGDQCLFHLRETLEHTGQEHFSGERVFGDVVGHRAGELAGDG